MPPKGGKGKTFAEKKEAFGMGMCEGTGKGDDTGARSSGVYARTDRRYMKMQCAEGRVAGAE